MHLAKFQRSHRYVHVPHTPAVSLERRPDRCVLRLCNVSLGSVFFCPVRQFLLPPAVRCCLLFARLQCHRVAELVVSTVTELCPSSACAVCSMNVLADYGSKISVICGTHHFLLVAPPPPSIMTYICMVVFLSWQHTRLWLIVFNRSVCILVLAGDPSTT
jgi:hypothetical protein